MMKSDNELIADFVGVKPEAYNYDYISNFKTDWDWLMPVVRKIVEISCNENEDAFLSDEYTSILETTPLAIIEDTYKVVVEFIKWYNEQK